MLITTPESVLDHFKGWEVHEKPFEHAVTLRDQFTPTDSKLSAHVRSIQWILNPVRKNGSKLHYPHTHLTGYLIALDHPVKPHIVHIKNQFTKGEWVEWHLVQPDHLLLPASKLLGDKEIPPSIPKEVDHFLCYRVDAPSLETKKVLEDQFDVLLKKKEEIAHLNPRFLAVSAKKLSDGHIELLHPEAHLAIYAISPQLAAPVKPPLLISTHDQFNKWKGLTVVRSLFLAVPSLKKWDGK